MATPTAPQLSERNDIHKSCKSIETLVNVFNDYCEAAGAMVLLQRKLVKALRETASLKTTPEIPANALNATAAIFEATSEIDLKYSKLVDKEYDGITTEVKKWFKKLAKEERNHDERLALANNKIKQAGQAFEKKSKKGARDAAEEHARYINLISTLGPEITQDKYDHALNVTQRHTTTTYNVASCLSRVADAEWQRTCESVRRYAPTVGQLGQWRALCEGSWTDSLPQDLPNVEDNTEHQESNLQPHAGEDERSQVHGTARVRPTLEAQTHEASHQQDLPQAQHRQQDLLNTTPRDNSRQNSLGPPSPGSQERATYQDSVGPSSFQPPKMLVDTNTGSVRSLSAFPAPPSHYPIPSRQQQASQSTASSSSPSHISFPTSMPRLSESPLPESEEEEYNYNNLSPPPHRGQEGRTSSGPSSPGTKNGPGDEFTRPSPTRAETALSRADTTDNDHDPDEHQFQLVAQALRSPPVAPVTPQRGDIQESDKEFGVTRPLRTRTMASPVETSSPKGKGLERTDTGNSTGSVVAALRSRYTGTSGAASPPPRDVPRLPKSVSDLATMYQPGDGSGQHTASPTVSPRQLPPPPPPLQDSLGNGNRGRISGPSASSLTPTPDDEATRRRQQQRVDEHAESEIKDKERALWEREREIQIRTRELELERARLIIERDGGGGGMSSNYQHHRPRVPSLQQLGSQADSDYSDGRNDISRNRAMSHRYSQSATHLALPSGAAQQSQPRRAHSPTPSPSYHSDYSSQPPSPSIAHQQPSSKVPTATRLNAASSSQVDLPASSPHAPYCGCDRCSIAKYKSPSSKPSSSTPSQSTPINLNATSPSSSSPSSRRPTSPVVAIPGQPTSKPSKGGWMRRLSMPVVSAAFLSSSSSTSSPNSATSGGRLGLNSNGKYGNGVSSKAMFGVSRSLSSSGESGGGGGGGVGGRKNASVTSLVGGRGRVQEDGRMSEYYNDGGAVAGRTGYDSGALANRSTTNMSGARR